MQADYDCVRSWVVCERGAAATNGTSSSAATGSSAEKIEKLVEGAIDGLRDDERERVSCGVDANLLRVRRG